MSEEVLFETESKQTRAEIASYLRSVADRLESGEDVTLSAGDQSVTLRPPSRSTFEVKAEREGPAGESGTMSVEFEIEWSENGGDGELVID